MFIFLCEQYFVLFTMAPRNIYHHGRKCKTRLTSLGEWCGVANRLCVNSVSERQPTCSGTNTLLQCRMTRSFLPRKSVGIVPQSSARYMLQWPSLQSFYYSITGDHS